MRISRLLGATAIASVLAMPAMAQTIIQQGTNVNVTTPNVELLSLQQLNQAGGFDFSGMPLSFNDLAPGDWDTSPGRTNASEVVQIATGNLNVMGAGSIGDFVITQGAGNYMIPGSDPETAALGNTVVSIVNANGLWTDNPLLSSTVVSGSQIGQISVNGINTSVGDGATAGNIWQQAGTDGWFLAEQPPGFGFPSGEALSVDNAMIAITQNGIAEVRGTMIDPDAEVATDDFIVGGMQAAIVNLNTANIEIAAGGTLNLLPSAEMPNGVKQELTGNNSIGVRNIAAAVSEATTNASIDPSVSDIRQMAVANINTMAFSTPDGDATVRVHGGQFGVPDNVGVVPGLADDPSTQVRLGNVAVAVAGSPTVDILTDFTMLNDPGAWQQAPAAGVSVISGVEQVAALQFNTISNQVGVELDEDGVAIEDGAVIGVANLTLSGGADLGTLNDGFTQSFDGTTLNIVPVVSGGDPSIVNLLVASTGVGSADIVDSSQAFVVNVNSVDVGGVLSGGLQQEALDVGAEGTGSFTNYAVAGLVSGTGAAQIDGLTQIMQQSYNSVGAESLNGLTLEQTATNMQLANTNVATASGPALASLTGVIQVSSLNVNSISTNAIANAGSILQTAGNSADANTGPLRLTSLNTMSATGAITSVQSAIQQSSISVNSIGVK